ncbi:glucose-6-phosphate dehydrogenase (coenzyme-F420) [Actinoalloteichus sp. AHMU CJ021]|uniref:Coenzyme F420-dependent glucose-6-phosphate dehydrogenase n=1 Tax=Actinoalloteichus caeruleus DSM 43889 TaxID=1120930 RepID=A0ABT1JQR5_ACTCY|nr:glucose-6-phosphate dehydrogenase (coenzyme-F420) [Actinoalloteichus caeruleus]AUS80250.1 glucose-6-phosphate dehydrogenase (coenzyme-F420) [Actinoalloteichus sp. AHMU CJ021]MCP2334486.1 coenzyme F420-dependent glucose-6-phosphate dehydrogenase [Actinoalloteichus caeruleus DSM 43889]
MVKLGYKASAEQFGPRQLLEFGVLAEQAGFDSVMVSDHFQPWKHTDGHAPYSFAWLGALGERTSRITIGTSVLTPTFRYHPSVVAQAVATLGVLFPGRVLLGVGTGESLNEVPATAMEWPEYRERLGRFREAVDLIEKLWREDFVTYEGEYYQTSNATIYDKPDAPLPVYLAAGGPRMARYAGRTAQGMICTSGKGEELYRDSLLPALVEGAVKASRDPRDIERMIEVKVSFDTDHERALSDTRNWAALGLPAESKVGVEDPREMERLADSLTTEEAAKRWIVSSDADEHVEMIRRYVDLGFTHLVFHAPGDDQARFMELYAERVLPRLRDLTPGPLPAPASD